MLGTVETTACMMRDANSFGRNRRLLFLVVLDLDDDVPSDGKLYPLDTHKGTDEKDDLLWTEEEDGDAHRGRSENAAAIEMGPTKKRKAMKTDCRFTIIVVM